MKKTKINILDYGHVEYVEHMGSDLTVVNAARVSFNKESDWSVDEDTLADKDIKLINYLAKHQHWTPFAHPQITLRVKAPIFVRTQLFKHKVGMVENEMSRRYVTDTPEFYTPVWRNAPINGAKQGSYDFVDPALAIELDQISEGIIEKAIETYKYLLQNGVAPEQARAILPQSTYTEWWWTGSLSAFARIFKQRSDAHAQWEVQQYASAIGEIIEPLFTNSWNVLTK
jgi:thymidylate synthase (FAD)